MSLPLPTRRRARIVGWSRVLAVACPVLAVLIVAAAAISLWSADTAAIFAGVGLRPPDPPVEIPATLRLTVGAILMLAPLAFVVGLLRLRAAFRAFAAGRFFDAEAFLALRGFAVALTVSILLRIVAHPAVSAMLSAGLTDTGSVSVRVGSPDLLGFAVAALIWVLSWILAEAAGLADENRQFV
ncbi:MAG: DUF2975 domain-containing protein [Inquilinaceae bacterium]